MVRFAVVDDEPVAIEAIVNVFEQIQQNLGLPFEVDKFASGKELLDSLHVTVYDALFLDIDMPQDSGFTVSAFLREYGNNIPIVYITNRDDLMQRAFQYMALGFVRKKHLAEELPFAVECVLKEIQKNIKKVILISAQKNKKTKHDVSVSNIVYIDTHNHRTTFHLCDDTSIVTRESLSTYLADEIFEGFIQIDSGCIVNYIHIYSIDKDKLILDNEEVLYISRRRTKTVKEQFLQLSRRRIL